MMMNEQNPIDSGNTDKMNATGAGNEEWLMLMSLALDGALDQDEQVLFAAELACNPFLAAEWAQWQAMDRHLDTLPAVSPSHEFAGRFEARLDAHLAKVKLWTTVVIVSATVAILLGVIALCAVYGGAILAGYGSYLSALWVNSTSSLITANSWYNTASTTAEVLVNTPQARAIMVGYLAAALAAGAGWLFWLRRVDGDKEMEVLA
jgi:anti-sigma factor RsiW